MDESSAHTANHHADHPGFTGATGALAGLTMLVGRGAVARLAADLTSVTRGDHVVDVGCGPGVAAREAARRGASVIGVDPAPVMLGLARLLTPRRTAVGWRDGTAEDIPQPDGAATVVWSLSTVHHWKDVAAGLAEVRRVLVPNGRFLAVERRVRPGATGLAGHGWTERQAEHFVASCRAGGLDDVRARWRTTGRREVVIVTAVRPPGRVG